MPHTLSNNTNLALRAAPNFYGFEETKSVAKEEDQPLHALMQFEEGPAACA
jgi:hypothetical protein